MKAICCIAPLLAALALLFSTSCDGGFLSTMGGGGGKVKKTNKALMSLTMGMNKNQVYNLAGTADKIEGYDWGSVWFYRTASGGGPAIVGGNEDSDFTPVVFDQSHKVTGFGQKYYSQTIRDLGTGQF